MKPLPFLLGTLLLTPTLTAAEPVQRPNVLFLFSDDQRADTVAALGNPHIHTPHQDALVQRGTAFTRAYCMGSAKGGAVCVPSRAMLMTGRTLFRIHEQLKDQPTWPEAFAQAGYATFMTGKWHNGPDSARRVFAEGRNVFFGGMGDPYKLAVQDFSKGGPLSAKRDSGEHSVALFADTAIDFLKHQTGEKPFVCYVAFNAPHDPRLAPPEYHARSNADKPPLPPNYLPQHPFNDGELVNRDEQLAPWPRTPEVVRQALADYYASIEFLDAQVGRILAALQAGGQLDNTIVVYSSDHGLAIGSHGLFGKQNLYDQSMHAPLIFAGPGVAAGKQSDALCYLLDIFPTLGALAGVPGPAGSEGKSLAGVIQGKEAKVRDSLFTAYRTMQRAVRDDRWKLIVYSQINKTQLFDLKDDPAEMHDLANEPAHAGDVSRLTALLEDWQTRCGDKQALRSDKPRSATFDFTKAERDRTAPRPHVVYLLADDMGYGDTGYHGSEIKTPNLDQLAARGAKLEQFYVQPVCSPTRAGLMTGRYPMRHGLQVGVVRPWAQYGLPLAERTLPQALKEVGYETAICGKWHLGHFQRDYLPTRRGFDHQYGHYNGAIDYFTHMRDGGFDWHRDDKVCRDEGYSTALLAKEAVRLIHKRDQSKPLFLYVPFNAVHAPHQVPDSYKEPYVGLKEPRRTYAGMTAALDEAVGTIVAALDETRMRPNTLIVFSSDNGGPQPGTVTSNGPLRAGKGTLYEGGTRVVASATWDGHIPPGSAVQQPLHVVDWYPTILTLAGASASLDQHLPLDGRDALATICGQAPSPHEEILLNTTPHNGAIRAGDWKLVLNGHRGGEGEGGTKELVELFNLADDLSEQKNLAAARPDKVKELRARYDALARQAAPPKAAPKAAGFHSPKVWGEAD